MNLVLISAREEGDFLWTTQGIFQQLSKEVNSDFYGIN